MNGTPLLAEAPAAPASVEQVAAAFVEQHGRPAAGVWSAPGRVNLIGEHVDYQDGLCLPMAISHRCYIAAAPREDDLVTVRTLQSSGASATVGVRLGDLRPDHLSGWSAYVLGTLWALREELPEAPAQGLDLVVHGLVPSGAGLSSSASLECAAAATAEDLWNLGSSAHQRIRASIRAENEAVGAATGGLDQSASILAREGEALLLDCRDLSTVPVPWDLAAEGLALLITDTRAPHALADGAYEERRRASEDAARQIGVDTLREARFADLEADLAKISDPVIRRRGRHVITEIERVRRTAALLEGGSVREVAEPLGVLLDASHASLREDYEVTVPELDLAVEAAREAGAYGARMTGGGFGGSIIALVEADQAEAVASAIADAFAARGLTAPQSFLAVPSAGARRER